MSEDNDFGMAEDDGMGMGAYGQEAATKHEVNVLRGRVVREVERRRPHVGEERAYAGDSMQSFLRMKGNEIAVFSLSYPFIQAKSGPIDYYS